MKSKKGIAILIFVVVISAFLHGCVENKQVENKYLSFGETAVLENGYMTFTVDRFEKRDTYMGTLPPRGASFLFVYAKAKNIGEVAHYVPRIYDIDLLYKDTVMRYRTVPKESLRVESIYDLEEIYPGVTEEGWIIYEVPKEMDISQAKIRYNTYKSYNSYKDDRERYIWNWNLT